jgi:uncharacterized protein
MIQFEKVEQFMLQKLQNELPQHLSYHSVSHVKDVMQAALNIARQEGVQQQEQILLQTAALFHDSGFLFGAQEHERKSCNIAREYLPQYGYDAQQIEQICGMIMATKIPQSPQNHLEEILADADLDYLGRDDFFTIGNRLFDELSMFGIVSTERDWNMLQLRFLESHHYFTKTAIALRNEKKQEHLNYIENQLNTHE